MGSSLAIRLYSGLFIILACFSALLLQVSAANFSQGYRFSVPDFELILVSVSDFGAGYRCRFRNLGYGIGGLGYGIGGLGYGFRRAVEFRFLGSFFGAVVSELFNCMGWE